MIGIIGVSHKSAPVEIREKLAFEKEEANVLAHKIVQSNYLKEVLILSTCNRTEIYFYAEGICTNGAFQVVHRALSGAEECGEELNKYLFQYYYKDAINHLFKVVSGLDSMVLGEYQIVSQVKKAYAQAEENNTIGNWFKRLFNKAFECGKLVRTKTAMSQGAFSVSYAAVEKCCEQFPDLPERNILLIGAGDNGELVIKNMAKKGCKNIHIVNRTCEKAQELALRYNGKVLPFDNMMQGIHDAEIIVSSVSTKEPLFDAKKVRPFLNGQERIVMIDLGIPRNIHPDVGDIPKVKLLNVDDLKEVVALNAGRKQEFVSVAEGIVEEKVTEFIEWLNVQNLAPAIYHINKMVSAFFANEVELVEGFVSCEERIKIENINHRISKKMRNTLVKNLKRVTDNGRITEFISVIDQLYSEYDEV